ncbi:MAG: AAA family ATPase [Clostridiaceae bacterium]|nr:AAA family ATPase [Clostridiaceae bacterium]
MKIKLLDIKGFGKLNKVKIAPKEGFNIIFETNESGKSTLQAFIRAMLYGQRGGRKSKEGSLPPLKHNKPWSSEQYAGIMEYTLENGKSYRVGRNFEKGTTNIYDDGANNLTNSFPTDKERGPMFADEHLGIDEAAFERSAFIGQLQSVIDEEGKKNLVDKLSNLNTTGSEDISLTGALKVLDSTLLERVGTKTSTTRPLDKINNTLAELEREKSELEKKNESFMDTVLALREQKAILGELDKKLEQLYIQKKAMKTSRLLSLKKELEALILEKNRLEELLNESNRNIIKLKNFENITMEAVSEIAMMLREDKQIDEMIQLEKIRLSEFQEKSDELLNSLEPDELFEKKMEEVQTAIEIYNEAKERNKNRVVESTKSNISTKHKQNWMPFILPAGLLSAMLMVAYYFYKENPLFLAVGAATAVITLVVFFISIARQRNNGIKYNTAADELNEVLSEAGFTDMVSFIKYREAQIKTRELQKSYKKQILSSKDHIERLSEKKNKFNEIWDSFIEDCKINYYDTDRTKVFESIKNDAESYFKAIEEKKILLSEKDNLNEKGKIVLREAEMIAGDAFLSTDDFINYVNSLNYGPKLNEDESTLAKLDETIKATENRKIDTELKIAAINARLEQAPAESEISTVLEKISYYTEKKEELEMKGSALILASQVLKAAALNMQRDYIPYLNEKMSKMMNILSAGRYLKIRTNDELNINLESPETDELIPVNRLSAGTIDQVYFCMRLAAVTLIEKDREILPLFLDEPFSQYDEERVKNAFELLKVISTKRQVFFFTCREREYEIAASVFGDSMNRIRLS